MNAAITELKTMYLRDHKQRYPSLPDPARVAPTYTDKTANGLTRCVIDYIRLMGYQAERIAVTGRYLNHRKTFTDVMSNTREIGSGKWIPGSMQKGAADISAVINGRAVKIEVKINDKQSEVQRKYQEQVEAAGGIYLIVRSFESFKTWFDNIK